MSATASQAPGQGLSSAFQSNEGSRHIGSDSLAPPYPKPHSYIADGPPIGAVPMDTVSLLASNPNQLINLQPYPGNSLLPPDFKGQIPMIPPSLYSIPTSPKPKRSAGGRKRLPTDGMSPKKIDFLERNRKAALKCRQRKKDEFRRVEESIKLLNLNNSMLTNELQIIGQEAMKLRTLLISHGGCPVAQKAGIMGEATLPLPTQMLLPVSLNGARFQTFQ
ncbi:Transcription factor [Massospora cicadina]|nr:Transcription factor [Massospora cicadina]